MSDGVSIPSSTGSQTVFTVSGTHTVAYADLLQNLLLGASQAPAPGPDTTGGGGGQVGDLNTQFPITAGGPAFELGSPMAGYANEAVLSPDGTTNAGGTFTLPVGWQYLYDNIDGASTVHDDSTGGFLLVAGGDTASAMVSTAGSDLLVFADGNNVYDGALSAGLDTVVAGSGNDTITTGAHATDIFGGAGHTSIVLNDTAPGAAANDIAVLEDGAGTVMAWGASDAVLALSAGQSVSGGQGAGNHVNVLLAGGQGSVAGGSGLLAVEGYSSGNTVTSGSGSLWFVGGADSTGGVGANTVEGTHGGTIILFGTDQSSITYHDDGTVLDGRAWFVAGEGNETLNAAGASHGVDVFGATGVDPAQANDQLVGGAGNDRFLTGQGHETLTGGAGDNVFVIASTGNANTITITDFGASAGNVVGFSGYSAAQVAAAEAGAHEVSTAYGNALEITFQDGTSVFFAGVTSLTGHTA